MPKGTRIHDGPGPGSALAHSRGTAASRVEVAPLEALRAQLALWVPPGLTRFARRARATVRGRLLEHVPLPLYEVWKLRSLDPFVARATTLSSRTTGRHFLVLAGVPMTESGGGQRSAQITLELLRRGHRVTYVHRFASGERGRRRAPFAHENLTQCRFAEFSARAFAVERGLRERLVAMLELPLPEYRACASYLRQHRAQIVYDCSDTWDTPQGERWYTRRAEEQIAREADVVLASSRGLKESLERRWGRDVALVPNAVDPNLFARGRTHERPLDLPRGEAVFVYTGAVWGEWFDWPLLRALARARPTCAVVLIGEYRGGYADPPRNVHFLGLRPQIELPAYLSHADVCLVPFKGERQARAVSPLKAFEYVAMGKPVVATDMLELTGLPGVLVAKTQEEFVARVAEAQTLVPDKEAIDRFVAENTWRARMRQIEQLLGV